MKNAFLIPLLLLSLATPAFPAPDETAHQVFEAAQRSVGKKMWVKGYGLANGTLGCAAALCNVLQAGGIKGAHSATVTVVRNQLLHGPTPTTELILRNHDSDAIDETKLKALAQPGDVVLAFMAPPARLNAGPNAHCGIMGENGDIFTNDWRNGVWTKLNIHLMFDYYPYIRLVRFGKLSRS